MEQRTTPITTSELLGAMVTVVARQGADFVYALPSTVNKNCYYKALKDIRNKNPLVTESDPRWGTPCLIGAVLIELREFRLRDYDDSGFGKFIGAAMNKFPGIFFTWHVFMVAAAAQVIQDQGGTWGTALQAAITKAEEHDVVPRGNFKVPVSV